MFSKSKLMFPILFTVVLIHPAFAVDETNDTLMPKGVWKDPATGLIWDRCSLGQTWNGSTCTGVAKVYEWDQALNAIKAHQVAGYTDWQLPEVAQLTTLIKCNKGFLVSSDTSNGMQIYKERIPAKPFIGEFDVEICSENSAQPAIDQTIFPNTSIGSYRTRTTYFNKDYASWVVSSRNGYMQHGGMNYARNQWDKGLIRLVRTNQSLGREAFVALSERRQPQVIASLKQQKDEEIERKREEAKREAIREAAERKASEEESRKYEQKVSAFRKSVKEGDDTSQGVVVQVKGNLVKIQTNDSQCSQRDYRGDCVNRINTPIEKWFKRSEIYPQ